MRTLTIALPGREYNIQIGRRLLVRAGEELRAVLLRASRPFVVTGSHVAPLYLERVRASLEEARLQVTARTVPAGESSEYTTCLAELWETMMDTGLTRTGMMATLGGGVVGDLAEFAAATILREVDFVQIPTTLLVQVDSSVGDKVAAGLERRKNLAGVLWQPRLMLIDPEVLGTLSLPVFVKGMAEMVRYGYIEDAAFFDFLAARPSRAELMAEMKHTLYTCYAIKRSVVEQDERGAGERMLPNFDHMLGHAYELAGRYTEWSHSAAVAAGMCVVTRLGVRLEVAPAELPEHLEETLSALGLPTAIPCTTEDYAAVVGLDKKGTGENISMILPKRMGRAAPYWIPESRLLKELR